jgi:TusA-related sulfurtransferase
MHFDFSKLVLYLIRKARLVRNHSGPVIELDLQAPVMVPNVCVVRALVDKMLPGQQIIFRTSDQEMPWEMEHFCNRLGHELLEVEQEGSTYFFTLRVRGDEDRLPLQDPFELDLSPPNPIRTIDITPNREPWRLNGTTNTLTAPPLALKAK